MRNPTTTTTTTTRGGGSSSSTSSIGSMEGKSSRNKITPCCSKVGLKRGPWTPEEDEVLASYIKKEGEGRWRTLPKRAGLLRCGKSCRLRWMNYLRPSVKRGHIAPDEEDLILRLHRLLGNRWSLIAGRIPGRTDNEIKNYWNTHLSKKLISQGIDPRTHKPLLHLNTSPTPPPPPPPHHHHHINKHSNSSSKTTKTIINPPSNPSPNPNPNNHNMITDQQQQQQQPPDNGFLIPINNNNNKEKEDNGFLIFHATAAHDDDHHHHYPIDQTTTTTAALAHHIHPYHPTSDHYHSQLPSTELPEDDDEDMNYCTDDVFSSFLNSLINDDAFAAHQHAHPIPNPNPNPSSNLISITSTTATAPTTTYALPTTSTWPGDSPLQMIISSTPTTTTTFNHNHPNTT